MAIIPQTLHLLLWYWDDLALTYTLLNRSLSRTLRGGPFASFALCLYVTSTLS